ncbi:MAG: hypothetical protein Q7S40_14185 [Opitutaceae bacterium]|nr:hypothetical protein [Opitutaceae bacterium]
MSFAALQFASVPAGVRQIPNQFWMWVAAGVVGIILLVVILRKLAGVNKLLLIGIVLFVCTIIGFNWIYERNEPVWATPTVNWLAGFFPSKGTIKKF